MWYIHTLHIRSIPVSALGLSCLTRLLHFDYVDLKPPLKFNLYSMWCTYISRSAKAFSWDSVLMSKVSKKKKKIHKDTMVSRNAKVAIIIHTKNLARCIHWCIAFALNYTCTKVSPWKLPWRQHDQDIAQIAQIK